MDMFCGIDWSEDHHDVALVDATGQMLAQRRIPHSAAGFVELLDLLAAHGDTAQAQVPVAIETPRGLLVSGLRATGRPVYAINPLSVSRYRDRRTVSRGKSDPGEGLSGFLCKGLTGSWCQAWSSRPGNMMSNWFRAIFQL